MNRQYYERNGKTMLDSFKENWECPIRVYSEEKIDFEDSINVKQYDLFELEPECKAFIERHKDRGDQQNPLELHRGAVRFAYKTFSVFNAVTNAPGDYVVWIDADTYTHTPFNNDIIRSLIEPDCLASYLGRENNYSECGFVIYNTQHPRFYDFISSWKMLYLDDSLFNLEQWHDSFVFDQVRKAYEQQGVKFKNITPEGKDYDHVFINSILGDYMDHMKGPRKNEGKSRKSDLYTKKSSEYWN